ncbi:uncharacterized protein AB675_3261 [Cyphellophora attinorum]|uniref:DUF6604 domain-containing protein n=1 Tax=Cyphellophora attinorum TaxID=1664694 RepID=A0A0N0NLP7_9EURO|nr:uncharacterized protein AB675_3261 [Phialophora attinorum]KPI39551.1 hypothetical protein AB675_3261 [Phialophora attinorum]
MLPAFLKDSYKQYKNDTTRFTTWLVNAAVPYASSQQVWHLRLQQRRNPHLTVLGTQEVSVSNSELIKAALPLADSQHKAPSALLTVLRRAISLRKNVTAWCLGRRDKISNSRHAHFVEVLEQIVETLAWETANVVSKKISNESQDKVREQNKEDDAQSWINRFAALEVEDLEDVESRSDSLQIIKAVPVEEEDSDDDGGALSDMFFRLYCLFSDLHNWRLFLQEVWREYADRSLDLMTASVVTDTALQLSRDLIDSALKDLPDELRLRLVDGEAMSVLMFNTACMFRDGDMTPSTHLGLTYNVAMDDVAEKCYIKPLILLQSMIPVLQAGNVPVYKPGYFGTYDPKTDREKKSVPEKFQEDKIILLEIFPEFCQLEARVGLDLPVRDEITAGFIDFLKKKKVSLWLSFAVQILLDAHHACRRSRTGAFGDLRMCSLRITRTIDDYFKLAQTHPQPGFWPKTADEGIKDIRTCIETMIEKDILREITKSAHITVGRSSYSPPSHLLFSRHPVFCGLFMLQLNLRMQTCGQALINQWYDVQQLAFLANLVQQQAPGPKLHWPDIDVFVRIHGEKQIFIGDRPKDAAQSLNRLELATGISSATRLAKDTRGGRKEWHRPYGKDARLLKPTNKAVNLFRARYETYQHSNAELRVVQHSDISKYLDLLSQESTESGKAVAINGSGPLPVDKLTNSRWRKEQHISGLQLLSLMKRQLYEEEPILTFDYFGMHKRCIEVLRLIKAKEHHKFVQYFTDRYMPNDSFIANLVLLILHVARGSGNTAKSMNFATDEKAVSRMVVSCGEVMAEYLKTNGETACKQLKTFCVNKRAVERLIADDKAAVDSQVSEKGVYTMLSLEDVIGPLAIESIRTGIPIG